MSKKIIGKSPYSKFGKRPYRYSDLYRRWHELAVKSGTNDTEELRQIDAAHAKAFSYRRGRCMYAEC